MRRKISWLAQYAKLFFLKSQRGRLRVQWKHYKLSECKRIFPGTCKPTYKSWWNQWRNRSYCWTLNRSNWMSIRIHAQKNETHSVRAKNADCTCIHSTKFKVQRWALWLCTYTFQPCSQFPWVWDCWTFWFSSFFGLNWKKKKKQQQQQPHYKRITFSMHPVFHPISLCYIRSAVVLRGLPVYSFSLFAFLALSAITISDSILAIDVTLDRQNVHLLCILISTHLLHFMTAEIASILRQCFDLVNYSLSSAGGLHASSSLVWNKANSIFSWSNR